MGHPLKAFRRALTHHLTGVDGRVPFAQDEEKAILEVARNKETWENLQDQHDHAQLASGSPHSKKQPYMLGFRGKGFHERMNLGDIEKLSNVKKRAKVAHEQLTRWKYKRMMDDLAEDEDSSFTCSRMQATASPHAEEESHLDHQKQTDWIWSRIYEIRRNIIRLTSPQSRPASMIDAERLLNHASQLPHDMVLVISLTAASWEDRILAQDPKSQEHVGPIAMNQHTRTLRSIFPVDQNLMECTATAWAMHTPGQQVPFVVQITLTNGNRLRCSAFATYFPSLKMVTQRFLFQV